MPKRPSSPAQIASRFTYFLKGDLKRKEQLFILIAKKLVRVRDENLWQTLKHPSIEEKVHPRSDGLFGADVDGEVPPR